MLHEHTVNFSLKKMLSLGSILSGSFLSTELMVEGVKHSRLLIFFFCGDVRFGGDPPLGSDNNSKYLNPCNLKECSEYQMSILLFSYLILVRWARVSVS